MSGPLTGIRVIDLSAMLSGPWAADILGDQGAEVIKVEAPGVGDHVRALRNQVQGMSSMFVNINRSKRSADPQPEAPRGRPVAEAAGRDGRRAGPELPARRGASGSASPMTTSGR